MAYADPKKQREYSREHYLAHKADYLARNSTARAKMRTYIQAIKRNPCADCKKRYPYYVMDFDHRPGVQKAIEPTRLIPQMSWRRLREELAKCDLVCSNCHRIRTHERARQYGDKPSRNVV